MQCLLLVVPNHKGDLTSSTLSNIYPAFHAFLSSKRKNAQTVDELLFLMKGCAISMMVGMYGGEDQENMFSNELNTNIPNAAT